MNDERTWLALLRCPVFVACIMSFGWIGVAAIPIAAGASQTASLRGTYDVMELPTPEEQARLEQFAMSCGVDLDGALKELPEDSKGWSGIFALSLHFDRFDRQAEVYGYRLFTASAYFMDSAGEAKFVKIVEAQPPKVRQRVRDFLYYEAINPDRTVTKNNERLLRRQLKLLFPASYSFAEKDPIFAAMRGGAKGSR